MTARRMTWGAFSILLLLLLMATGALVVQGGPVSAVGHGESLSLPHDSDRSPDRLATAGRRSADVRRSARTTADASVRPRQAAQAPAAEKPFEPQVGQKGKDVVWVPTSEALVEKMLDLAGVTSADYVIDLGSGDGRTVIAAARRGARALGIEYDPKMVELSRKKAEEAGVSGRATFVQGDLFKSDLSKATVITMFLLPEINLTLRPTLLTLQPGTRIVSNSFDMGEWEEDDRASVTGEDCSNWCTALLWIVPARVDGVWQLPQGTLRLTQEFQEVSGTLDSTPIANGRLHGRDIRFTAGGVSYAGRVNGQTIQGTRRGSANGPWTARRVE